MKAGPAALLLSLCASLAFAQAPPPPAPKEDASEDVSIDAAERAQAVTRILEELEKKYVFPELARKQLPELRRRWTAERLAQYSRAGPFADALNADLAELFDDKHLSVQPPVRGARPAFLDSPAAYERFLKARHYQVRRAEVLAGNVGYVRVDGFAPSELAGTRRAVAEAMAFVAGTDALIIDLRKNGGGDLPAVAHLVSYFVDGRVHLLDTYDRITGKHEQSWTLAKVQGPRYGTKRPVYVLISRFSFSAAEEFAYDMQGLKRATLVGETSGGGANNNEFVRVSEHLDLSVPFGTVTSVFTGKNWEHVGVKPELPAPFERTLKVAHEAALKRLQEGTTTPEARMQLELALESARAQPDEQAPPPPPGARP